MKDPNTISFNKTNKAQVNFFEMLNIERRKDESMIQIFQLLENACGVNLLLQVNLLCEDRN